MKKLGVRFLNILFFFLFCTGFQVWPSGNKWQINKNSTTESKLFVTYPNASRTLENNVPEGDPLYGAGTTITVQQAMNSIFDDFNNIQAAFITLVDEADADFALRSEDRKIKTLVAQPGGLSGGEARGEGRNGLVVGCSIVFKDEVYKNAKSFIGTLTHEIGHCLGLAHPQETTWSIMSYFKSSDDMIRLQADDKMGIVYSYPVDEAAAKEAATFGFQCARRQ